jgi:hypothetical protein
MGLVKALKFLSSYNCPLKKLGRLEGYTQSVSITLLFPKGGEEGRDF